MRSLLVAEEIGTPAKKWLGMDFPPKEVKVFLWLRAIPNSHCFFPIDLILIDSNKGVIHRIANLFSSR
jgi:hypothetical protein